MSVGKGCSHHRHIYSSINSMVVTYLLTFSITVGLVACANLDNPLANSASKITKHYK